MGKSFDAEKFAAAVAKMREPTIHLHPDDWARLRAARGLLTIAAESPSFLGIPIVQDAMVPRGEMLVLDRALPELRPMEISRG